VDKKEVNFARANKPVQVLYAEDIALSWQVKKKDEIKIVQPARVYKQFIHSINK